MQLRQRVSTICRLDLLTAAETTDYIDYRLRQAGYDGDPLFTDDALKLIAESGYGTPRLINNLCYNALTICSTEQCKQVDSAMVAKVVANLQLFPQLDEPIAVDSHFAAEERRADKGWKQVERMLTVWGSSMSDHIKLWVPAVAALMILCVLGVLRLGEVGVSQVRIPGEERILDTSTATESVPEPVAARIGKATTQKPVIVKKSLEPGSKGSRVAERSKAGSPASNSNAVAQSLSMATGANPLASKTAAAPKSASAAGPATPTQASLNIDSFPRGADIEIDGAFVGNTPSTISITPGSHQIAARKKGFVNWSRSLNVTGGAIHLNAELEQDLPKQ